MNGLIGRSRLRPKCKDLSVAERADSAKVRSRDFLLGSAGPPFDQILFLRLRYDKFASDLFVTSSARQLSKRGSKLSKRQKSYKVKYKS